MKHAVRCLAAAAALSLASFAASAQEAESPYSWNVTAVSDYVFRGVSQTDEDPTLQAGFTYTSPVGLYAGVWGSGVDFGPGDPSTEVDFLIGYGFDVSDNVNFDVLFNRYTYPGASELNYNELITSTTFAEQYKLTVAYTNDLSGSDTKSWYYAVGGEWALPQDFTLAANVGRTSLETDFGKDYTDFNIGVSRQFGLFNLGLGFHGTDGAGRDNNGYLADNRVVFTVAIGK